MDIRIVALLAIGALVAGIFALRLRGALPGSFVPNANNDTALLVRGWAADEMKKILVDFAELYDIPQSTMRQQERPDGVIRVTFPNDIEPRLLHFLVNYVAYPKDFDSRPIAALCRVTLTSAFGRIGAANAGVHAAIYVPDNDSEYDEVYVKLDSGNAYRVPFTNMVWHSVDDARTPSNVAGL